MESRRFAALAHGNKALADAHFVTRLDVDLADDSSRGGRDGSNGFFVFQFEDGLIFGDRIALFHEDIDHDARIGPLTQVG